MQCHFSFKHMESSQGLIDYAEKKIVRKIERYSTKPIEAHVVFSIEGAQHNAAVNVVGGDGFSFQVEAASPDMYASIDLLLDKLDAKLKKHKEKLKNHKNHRNLKSLSVEEEADKDDCDNVPVDAKDLLKFEKAKSNS